jgi:DNA sulfur modification protein DndC
VTSLFDSSRTQMTDSIRLSLESLNAYAGRHDRWCIAWSGGKDSTATVSFVAWAIESGRVPRPKSLAVLYADTRQELLPLWLSASEVRGELAERGIEGRVVTAPLDRRMWVYILGRGVPPPNNNTLRYCTRMIKIDPMQAEVRRMAEDAGGKVLMLTGVRVGESAARDQRIALSCSRNGAECGQGWFQETTPADVADTLAPLLHWRVCHVWEWLRTWAPLPEYGEWPTRLLADAYGGDEAEEVNARTGCVCCPLASKDSALEAIVRMPRWSYLAPLRRVRELYHWLRLPANRLRKPGGERRKDGTLCANQMRLGPLTTDARLIGLDWLRTIQNEVNAAASASGSPPVDHLDREEEARILELIAANTWPDGWDGTEPRGDELLPEHHADGSVQGMLWETNDWENAWR